MNSQLSALLKPSGSTETPEDAQSFDTSRRSVKTSARDWRARFATALPWLLILGFLGLLAAVLGNRLIPAKELSIATVVTVRQNADAVVSNSVSESTAEKEAMLPGVADPAAFEAPMLFQASGWIEPDPFATKVTALVDGVVETVEVLEGDNVEKGQLLATLIDDDASLDLETSKGQFLALEAQCDAHLQQIQIVEAEVVSLQKQIAVAEARRDETADLVRRLDRVPDGAVAEREKAKTRLSLLTLEAEIEALSVTENEFKARIKQLEKTKEDFEARMAVAKTEVARKKLALDRTQIKSPITGRVLRLLSEPGQKKMLAMDSVDSATIAILYNPERLQARIDVPLAEAAQLAVGQPVRLRSELLPGKTFRGRVTRIVGEADLQRNTLQAKVEIESPDDRLRPEMLCRAEFLALSAPAAPEDTSLTQATPSGGGRVQIFAQVAAIVGDDNQEELTLWKVDESGNHIVPQMVTLGRELREDHRHVTSGLKPGDRVVLNPPADLKSGDRFRPAKSSHSNN